MSKRLPPLASKDSHDALGGATAAPNVESLDAAAAVTANMSTSKEAPALSE